MKHDELIGTLVVWVVSSVTTTALLVWDRRRLDEVGRQRRWRRTTLYLAVSGLFVPAPLTFGAHLWVTRPWPLWKRLPLALANREMEGEWGHLISLVTIKESYFFRAPQQFEVIRKQVLPGLVRARSGARSLRMLQCDGVAAGPCFVTRRSPADVVAPCPVAPLRH